MKFSGLSRLSFSAPIDNIDFFCYHRFRKILKKQQTFSELQSPF